MRVLCLYGFLAMVLFPALSLAQETPFEQTLASITTPDESFEPGERVELSLKSYSLNLDQALVRWSAGTGSTTPTLGGKTFLVTAGPLGSVTRVVADVFGKDGSFITRAEATISPAAVDIVWESTGYTPPFYFGKPMPTPGASIRAYAVPVFSRLDGTPIPSEGIVFTWALDGKVFAASGLGRDSIVFPLPEFPGENILTVDAATQDGIVHATAKVRLPSQSPLLILYPVHPLIGIDFRNPLRNGGFIEDTEGTFSLIPYFASIATLNDPLVSVSWSINDTPASSHDTDQFSITIVSPAKKVAALIGVSIEHARHLLLSTRASWKVTFGESPSSSTIDVFGRPVE